jgi:hypothetical protein
MVLQLVHIVHFRRPLRYATDNPARIIQAGLCLPTTLDYLKSTRFIMLLDV